MLSISWAIVALVILSSVISSPAWAEAAQPDLPVIPLWPEGVPGQLGSGEADNPCLLASPAPKDIATGAACIVAPGGGYGGLAIDHEGYQIVEWLNRNGIHGFILKYRVTPYQHPMPLKDAQRAMRIVRSRAAEWAIDPARIGMLGFSAAGHLTSTLGTHFDAGDRSAKLEVERVSWRPDFLVLIYPVISMRMGVTHGGSRQNLLGEAPSEELVALLSNDEQVTKDTPPTFIVHTQGDSAVPVENSVLFYSACIRAKVPVEAHLYERGEHGFGLAVTDAVLSTWPGHLLGWLRVHDFIK